MVHFFIALVIIELSFDLYLSVVRVIMETTDPANGIFSFSEKNKGGVAEFHVSDSSRRSETKSNDAHNASV